MNFRARVPQFFLRSRTGRVRHPRRALALAPALMAAAWLSLSAAAPEPSAPPRQGQPSSPPPAQPSAPQTPPAQGAPAGQGQPAPGQPQQGQPQQGQPRGQGQPDPGQQDPAQGTPQFRTGINFVRVDVLVTDNKGNPVLDLKQEDFEVLEDSKPQTVESFRLIKISGNPVDGETPREIRSDYALETEAARDDVRIFAIFFDDYHVRRGASLAVKEPLIRFIRNQIGPMDLVGIAYPLTPFKDIAFTRNHEGVIRAIEKFDGRKYDYQPRNEFEEQYVYYPVETVERIRNQVSLSGVRSLVAGLGTMREGRKAVILVSEGYSNYVPPQMRDPSAAYRGLGNPNRNNPMAGEGDMNEDRARFFTNTDLLTDMREVFNEANRNNAAIYALDPRGLAAFEFDINEGVGQQIDRASLDSTLDSLRTLADETDGRAIINRNDLDVGLKQMMKDSSAYYLLGYNSSQAPQDGKFHQIKVRIKRPNVQIRARKGYWALTAAEVTRAKEPPKPGPDPALGRALSAIQAPNRARVIRTWIGTSRAENGKTAVTLVWEPVAAQPGDRREPPARVMVTALGEGTAFRGRSPDDNVSVAAGSGAGAAPGATGSSGAAPANGAAGSASGAGASGAAANGGPAAGGGGARGGRLTFNAAPGQIQLKLSVEGGAGQVLDSDFRDLVVPDYTKTDATLSEPAVYRARTQRDLAALSTDPQAMPTPIREFSRTERLLIRVAAYTPGGSTAAPTAELLNRDGKKMSDIAIKPFTGAGEGVYQAEVPLAGLPAGEFVVQFAVPGGANAKQMVGIRVTS